MKSTAYRLAAELLDTQPSGLTVVSAVEGRRREVPTIGKAFTAGSGLVAAVVSISRDGGPDASIELIRHSTAEPAPRDPEQPYARSRLRTSTHGRWAGRCADISLTPDAVAVLRNGYIGDSPKDGSPEYQATTALLDLFGSTEGHDLLSPNINSGVLRSAGALLGEHIHVLDPLHMAMNEVHPRVNWAPLR